MDELLKIKKLSNEIGEHSFFSITKRGIMWTVELIGWISTICLMIVSAYLFTYTPSLLVALDEKNKVELKSDIDKLNNLFIVLGSIVVVLAMLVLIVTLYIKRARKKKAKIHELTTMIKALK